jgi:hypothetical protein
MFIARELDEIDQLRQERNVIWLEDISLLTELQVIAIAPTINIPLLTELSNESSIISR